MTQPKHILLVEDEAHLAHGIKFNLQAEGYRVTHVAEGKAALDAVAAPESPVDLMVLDLMLPGMSGYAVCESLRAQGYDLPVLILSARTLAEDRTRGFDVGADQYLMKPFDLDELLSRVRNLLARHERRRQDAAAAPPPPPSARELVIGGATVHFDTYQVVTPTGPARLTQLEMKLLQYFAAHEGRVISRQELLEKVWDQPGNLYTRAVDQFIRRLRKVFETDPAQPRHFLTVRDAGYRFVAKGEEPSKSSDESLAAEQDATSSSTSETT